MYMSIGDEDTKTWPITSQNIINQRITNLCERCIYTRVYDIQDSALQGCVNTQCTDGSNLTHILHGR
jgi:hypothetical protein